MPSNKKSEEDLIKEKIKMEIAEELGLADKIRQDGWGALNSMEAGKIGGILSKRLKKGYF